MLISCFDYFNFIRIGTFNNLIFGHDGSSYNFKHCVIRKNVSAVITTVSSAQKYPFISVKNWTTIAAWMFWGTGCVGIHSTLEDQVTLWGNNKR